MTLWQHTPSGRASPGNAEQGSTAGRFRSALRLDVARATALWVHFQAGPPCMHSSVRGA